MAKNPTAETIQDELDKKDQKDVQNPNPFDGMGDDWNPDKWNRLSSTIWRPERGEFVLGTYQGCKPFEGDFDEPCKVHFIIDAKSGDQVSFVGGKMCDENLLPLKKGNRVFIRYMGQEETRKGNKVNSWDIRSPEIEFSM